jgi:hypothetical protein
MDYVPWLLDQLHKYELQSGKRVLDVFSLHYYPQGGEFGNDTSTSMQQLRNRSTRALWDTSYVDPTWINDKVMLIPRMKGWVNAYYPGLKIALTEYNWGAEGHINGATTQADIYGILGREGMDYATRWTTPDASTPTYKAMKLYRNYDGAKSGFGDTSVSATVPNADNLSAFAATRGSDGALTVMVVSKVLSGATPVTLNLANFANGGSAQVWQLTSANTIAHLANVALSGNSLSASVPAQSVTLFVVAAGTSDPNIIAAPSGLAASAAKGGKVTLRWTDNSGNEQGFAIERAPSGSSSYVQVGQVGANVTSFSQTVAKATYLYRVRAFNTSTGKVSNYSNVITVRVVK